jgi:hypothetical protein
MLAAPAAPQTYPADTDRLTAWGALWIEVHLISGAKTRIATGRGIAGRALARCQLGHNVADLYLA